MIRVAEKARKKGAITNGLTGGEGGLLKGAVYLCIIGHAQTEDPHLALDHALTGGLAGRVAMAEGAALAPQGICGDGRVVSAPIC